MARLFVNEQEIPPPPELSSLDQIVRHVEQGHLPPDSIIRQITIDGLPLVSDDLQQDPGELLEGIDKKDRIDIVTGTIRDVAADSIREAHSYLDRLTLLTPDLATSFLATPGPEAFESLRQLYEGFYWLNLLLDRLESTFKITLDGVTVEGVPARAHHRKFVEVLKQLVDSQERQDFILIADLLEYEILPQVPVWRKMFEIVASSLGSER
jgi:hypothetical protein